MKIARTKRFQKAYRKLEAHERERVKKSIIQLLADRNHPGLHVKRIQGTDRIWEMRAGRDIRITFEIEEDVYILRNVGCHDATLKRP
jgi:mRNA-degrading endonuclease RelE of RelBE toxin-antitoxin system